jgi:AcrR family transcriptional regulator
VRELPCGGAHNGAQQMGGVAGHDDILRRVGDRRRATGRVFGQASRAARSVEAMTGERSRGKMRDGGRAASAPLLAADRPGTEGDTQAAERLNLRRQPTQARGQATFDSILDATGQLLETVPIDALTTNLIAQAAAVNVATLYQYFPNKQSILLALFERQEDFRFTIVRQMIGQLGEAQDWRAALEAWIESVAQMRRNMPGIAALRRAMRTFPELLDYEQKRSNQIADLFAGELVRRGGVDPERAKLVALCSREAMASLLDMWNIETAGKDDRIIDEAKAMMVAYVAPYLDKTPAVRREPGS